MTIERKMYLVTHIKNSSEDLDDYKVIGIFSDELKAKKAILDLSQKPGFSDHTDGFNIAAYKIDNIGWEDGFISGFDAIVDD